MRKKGSTSDKKVKGKKLVIVESPVKARTISHFLGKDYVVESCMGHIRDLPGSSKELPEHIKKKPWAHFGVDVENKFRPFYCVPGGKKEIVKKLKQKINSVKELILATDEDREGESISWHLQETLKPTVPVKRMVFHEITKKAIQEALENFRSVNIDLVQAQEARRILDRLVGYSISPVLWKKVTRGLSAGRVQSVAVSLVSKRELERLCFQKSVYWDLSAENKKSDSDVFKSRLISHKGKRLVRSSDFDSITGELKKKDVLLMGEEEVLKLKDSLKNKSFQVVEVKKTQITRKPPPPFITSTLQQECNRKLGFSSKQTMGMAQKLYEQGLITYMRTDSTFLSSQALQAARSEISRLYGKSNLPSEARVYRKKARGAQEAHEAIRPSGEHFISPNKTNLSGQMLSLYELIWKRTLASQMKDCIQNQVKVKMAVEKSVFQTSGMTIQFPGFYLIYRDQKMDEVQLPDLKKGDMVQCLKIEALKHETKPPARYTEASLVQTLEKEGVGRPSTYASIIGTIQDRGYVEKKQNTLIPTFTALVVNHFLHQNFPDYVDTQFTSKMEKDLDDIALGKKDHVKYLDSVYSGSKGLKRLIETREKKMKDKTFRSLTLNGFEDYVFSVGPFGAYVSRKNSKEDVSASLPANLYPGEITKETIEQLIENKIKGGKFLGRDPETGQKIFVVLGRYGPYVKLESNDKDTNPQNKDIKDRSSSKKAVEKKKSRLSKKRNSSSQKKHKTASLVPFFNEETITLEGALKLLELPKLVGVHPETKKEIKKAVSRFGPYIVHDGDFRSVPADIFFGIDLKYAVQRLSESKRQSSRILKEFQHPDSNQPIQLMKGRYGPYVKYNKKNYPVPANLSLDDLELSFALKLIEEGAGSKKSRKGAGSKKSGKGAGSKKSRKGAGSKKSGKGAGSKKSGKGAGSKKSGKGAGSKKSGKKMKKPVVPKNEQGGKGKKKKSWGSHPKRAASGIKKSVARKSVKHKKSAQDKKVVKGNRKKKSKS